MWTKQPETKFWAFCQIQKKLKILKIQIVPVGLLSLAESGPFGLIPTSTAFLSCPFCPFYVRKLITDYSVYSTFFCSTKIKKAEKSKYLRFCWGQTFEELTTIGRFWVLFWISRPEIIGCGLNRTYMFNCKLINRSSIY